MWNSDRLCIIRDTSIWLTAISLTIYEAAFRSGEPRFALLTMYAAMLGLPALLRVGHNGGNGDGK